MQERKDLTCYLVAEECGDKLAISLKRLNIVIAIGIKLQVA